MVDIDRSLDRPIFLKLRINPTHFFEFFILTEPRLKILQKALGKQEKFGVPAKDPPAT